jgi:hypothetical protein
VTAVFNERALQRKRFDVWHDAEPPHLDESSHLVIWSSGHLSAGHLPSVEPINDEMTR